MRLADNEFTLTVGSWSFVLRPTLRAAFRLNQKYEGFQNLFRAIDDGSYSACSDLINQTCIDQKSWTAFSVTKSNAVRDILGARSQLLEFILVLSGANAGSSHEPAQAPITFEEYHTKLFQIGSGWLGWTPEATWSATPAEIINAHTGRLAMLAAVFGKRDDGETIDTSDASARAQLNALGDLGVQTMSQVRQCQ